MDTNVKAIELKDLWKRYKNSGDERARERLVVAYSPLVKYVAGRMGTNLPGHVDEADLISYGLTGLISAIERFDLAREIKFETYAITRIRGAIIDELRTLDWVPRSVHDKAKKVEHAMQALAQKNGSLPTDIEMARELKLTLDEYEELLEVVRPASYICLDSVPGNDGDTGGSHDFIADESQAEPWEGTARREMSSLIEERLRQLPEMQRKVLALYYFEDLRLREIAEAFGVTESRICQIHSQAILAIKALLKKQDPESFNNC